MFAAVLVPLAASCQQSSRCLRDRFSKERIGFRLRSGTARLCPARVVAAVADDVVVRGTRQRVVLGPNEFWTQR